MADRPFSVVNVALGAGVTLRPVPLERLNVPRPGRGVVAIPTDPCAPSRLAFAFDPANEGARTFCRHAERGVRETLQQGEWGPRYGNVLYSRPRHDG